VAEVRSVWDVDATTVVEEAVAFQPFRGLEGAGGRLSQFLCGSGDGFLLWLLSSLPDVSQDVLFQSGELQTLQCTYRKEFRSEEHNVGIVVSAGAMVGSAGECIWLTH